MRCGAQRETGGGGGGGGGGERKRTVWRVCVRSFKKNDDPIFECAFVCLSVITRARSSIFVLASFIIIQRLSVFCVWTCACLCVCVCACVRACVRACVCVCV